MPQKSRSMIIKITINVLTFVLLAFFVYTLRFDIASALNNARNNANLYVLLLIIPFQILNYLGQAGVYKNLLHMIGHDLPMRYLTRLSLELNFVNTMLPSAGVSGFSYFGLRLRTKDVGAGKATLVHIMKFVLLFVSFQILLGFGLLLLALEGKASGLLLLIAGSVSTFLVIVTLGIMFIIGSKNRINSFFVFVSRSINKLVRMVRPSRPETINIARVKKLFDELHENYEHIKGSLGNMRTPLLYALLANAAEVATIYVVYLAYGQQVVNLGAIIIAYAIANFAGLISVLPGGIGVYEGLMTAVLVTAGVPAGLSLPVTITYRILSMFIQLLPGYVLYHFTVQNRARE